MNYSVKNNQSFFAKVEILRILTFHFSPDLLPKLGQSPEKVSLGDRQNSQTPIYPNPNPTVWVPPFPETPPKFTLAPIY